MPKRTLYQVLQVSPTAVPEVIKAAFEARRAVLTESTAPEVAAESALVREAYEILADPIRRRLYDERHREELIRALASGGEEERPRPANARPAASPSSAWAVPLAWMGGVALLLAVTVGGAWVWLDHQRETEARKMDNARRAEESQLKQEQFRQASETAEWAKKWAEGSARVGENRNADAQREAERRRAEYEQRRAQQAQQMEERRRATERRQREAEERRQEEENLRRAQQQLERDRRYLQELERSRGMKF